jgi:Flp pilus assembly protein TadG
MGGGTPPRRGVTGTLRRRIECAGARGEHGAVLVLVLLWLPVLVLMAAFVIDVANWFVHKRHLQMQADAAALAAARDWSGVGCNNATINARAAEYGGGTYNAQIGGTAPSEVHQLINSSTYYNQATPVDDTVNTAPPCTAAMVDVKMTETNLPWYFKIAQVPFINAHARVSVVQASTLAGALPVGVPDSNPTKVGVKFVDETTGTILGERELSQVSGSGGNAIWDNSALPLPVSIDRSRIGVRVAVSYGTSLDCSNALVKCYDASSANTGVMSIRGFQTGPAVLTTDNPVPRDVDVINGDCTAAYFTVTTAACHVGINADIDFGTLTPVATVGAKVEATVAGTNQKFTLTYNTTTHRWVSANTIPIAAGAGSVPINLNWEKTIGTSGGITCNNKGNNPCVGTFTAVQRVFAGDDAHSGPIKNAHVFESTLPGIDANSLPSCASACTKNLVVELQLVGNLQNASSASDPPVALRVVGGSQNQSLDCDPAQTNLKSELATGCVPSYTKNPGTSACPAGASTLWASPQPWPCVAIQTGGATNQVPAGMNTRILGAEKPASCTSPNHWSSYPNISPTDPRIVQVFLTPFGSFQGSGNTTFPVTGFATFYVTGWSSQGSGFANPCEGQGDDSVPNNDAGYIMGHFINYIPSLSPGSGTDPCNPAVFGTCIITMTE